MLFKITTENFDGPISLLLQLIEKRKIPINDISLAEITEDYLKFIEKMENYALAEMSHFIFTASLLVLIKSKSLLPKLEFTEDEEEDIEELKKRINLLKIYQSASFSLKENFSLEKNFYRAKRRKKEIQFLPHESLKKEILKEVLEGLFAELPQKENKKKEASIRINLHIEDMMNSLEKRIKKMNSFVFKDFIKSESTGNNDQKNIKIYNVIGFLAVLEMVKNGIFHVSQKENFTDIFLEKEELEEKKLIIN